MFADVLKKIVGSRNDRMVKKFRLIVDKINALEPEISKLSDSELKEKTVEFRQRLADGERLDDILEEAFAVAREASKRTLGMRPFDVQLIGAIALHNGMIAEMKTGEGKTLVAVLAVYLNALEGKGVHVVTVNDYLASRDADWMGRVYRFLGLTVGTIVNAMDDDQRRASYACDVTYATNNELGFDYLRDNMKFRNEDLVQRPFNYAIVDEVDSILIDEARTPLIISGPSEDSTELYVSIDSVIPLLEKDDMEIDEKHKHITLTEKGNVTIERLLQERGFLKTSNLYDMENISLVHYISQALKAHHLFKRDVDYIVKNGKVVIIDEFTGRQMEGRRYSDGLHQAIEAKEHVKVQMENQTLASITFQNFFRMYNKLSGMTGTAETEAAELMDIYKTETLVIPTNLPVSRIDYDDEIYKTKADKNKAILKLVKECHAKLQPVLIGTISIESSELLSKFLKEEGIEHNVLNARYHDVEAQIIAEAGKPGAITIATNMAGRGTDIKLGGSLEVRLEKGIKGIEDEKLREEKAKEITEQFKKDEEIALKAGGLFVIGTERHESRRIDNQLRGRSGRQGDPGASKFFLSLQDDLMRIFGAGKLDAMLEKLGFQEGESITHPWVNKAVAKAQERVEARNCDIRKHLLKYDDVMNNQRKVIYAQRLELMNESTVISEEVNEMRIEVVEKILTMGIPENMPSESWDFKTINESVHHFFGTNIPDIDETQDWTVEALREHIIRISDEVAKEKREKFGDDEINDMERVIMLQLIDKYWKDHLLNLDMLRQGINLRAYGQRDPLNEYKQEAFSLFERMVRIIREEMVRTLSLAQPNSQYDEPREFDPSDIDIDALRESDPELVAELEKLIASIKSEKTGHSEIPEAEFREADSDSADGHLKDVENLNFENVGRNDMCPCGSNLRFKHCHGKIDE